MPARILVATLMRPEGETGVQSHFRSFLDYLAASGFPGELVTSFSAPRWQAYPIYGLRKLVDPISSTASVWWYRHWHRHFLEKALARRLADAKPCVVYAQCPPSADAALAARVAPCQRVVMIVHFNVSQSDEWADKGMIRRDGALFEAIRAFEARVLPSLDGLVFVSQFMRDELLRRMPVLARVPHIVAPNFVHDPGSSASEQDIEADWINVGTLEPRKNQAYLLEILTCARELGRRYSLTIVGDGPLRDRLTARARELGVSDMVRFTGFIKDAGKLIRKHRAYIHTAQIENLPIALIEAMSWGLPVIAAPVGGIPELFDDTIEGRFIPLDDPREAARIVMQLLESDSQRKCAGAAARRRFERCHDSSLVASRLREFLNAAGDPTANVPDLAGMNAVMRQA